MMVQRTLSLAAVSAALVLLSACGESPQNASGIKQDSAPYTGVGQSQYAQKDWKAGDRNGWEQQLKTRAQYGQNDYSRMPNQ